MKRSIAFLMTAALCAALALPAAAAPAFSDVPEDAWYAEGAAWCAESALMSGYGDGRFGPGDAATRAMLVKVLYNLAGKPQAAAAAFSDVAADAWYAPAVGWAAETGVTTGAGGNTFRPNDPLTRQQAAAFLWRYAGEPEAEAAAGFADRAAIASYAVKAVDWAAEAGIMIGDTANRFAPNDGATRAQLAVMLQRFSSALDTGSLYAPCGIVLDADGTFLITDTTNKVIWRSGTGGSLVYAGGVSVLGLYGEPLGGYNDGTLEESYFKEPWAISPFLDGWAVSDAANNVIRLVRSETVETVNGRTREKLAVTDMGVAFNRPTGLATDGDGNLYVSDTLNNAVRKITPAGEVSTVAKNLSDPTGLCWAGGSLYIAETGANRIVKLTGSSVTTVAGSGEADCVDGKAAAAAFNAPQGLVVDSDGTIYVSDTANGAIRRIRDGMVDTLLSRDWSDQSFFPMAPMGLALKDGNLYVCDNFSCKVFLVDLRAQ